MKAQFEMFPFLAMPFEQNRPKLVYTTQYKYIFLMLPQYNSYMWAPVVGWVLPKAPREKKSYRDTVIFSKIAWVATVLRNG